MTTTRSCDASPLVVPADRETEFLLMPRTPAEACSEQEHVLRVFEPQGAESKLLTELRVYSVKSDLHIHSNRSDGRETPAVVAAACREIRLDFMALVHAGWNLLGKQRNPSAR